MKWLVKITLLGIVVPSIVLFIANKYDKPKASTDINQNPCAWFMPKAVGNRLIEYFYLTNSSDATDEQISKRCECDKKVDKPIFKKFYSKLDWHRSSNLIDYQTSPETAWNQINYDGSEKVNYLKFWQSMRPIIREFYKNNLDYIKVTKPVIHFRCSDAPFDRNGDLHLVKVSTVKWIAEKIKEKGFSKVIMLSCNTHQRRGKQSQKACAKYTDFYVKKLKEYGLDVELQCNDILKDLAIMVHSPLLASLNASSFSFIAGVSKEPKDYISSNMGTERNDVYYFQSAADWSLEHNQPLLHKDVDDYYDVEKVIGELEK